MKNFFSFNKLFTPAILKTLYLVLVVLFAVQYLWQAFAALFTFRFIAAFTATVYLVAFPFILRIGFELVLVLFRIYENTYKLAHPDENVSDVVYSTEEFKKEVGLNQAPRNYQQPYNNNYNQGGQYYDPNQYQNPNQGFGQPQGFYQQPQQPQQGQGFGQAYPNDMPNNPNMPNNPAAPNTLNTPNTPQQ